jgi:hypothetical protein
MPHDTEGGRKHLEALERVLRGWSRLLVTLGTDHKGDFLSVADRDYPGIKELIRVHAHEFVHGDTSLAGVDDLSTASHQIARLIPEDA